MSNGLDNKISNILGGALPKWLKQQIAGRSKYSSQDHRDDENILYLANKTAWIRMISSVNINSETVENSSDIKHFSDMGVDGLYNAEDLAKKYTLFGGTSQYLDKGNKNSLRYGLEKDGAYNLLGDEEVKTYGYRPMPGIQSATIETQGRLGSVKMATISFKVWDKMQLDIIDSLYFKLGYTMLLEWGHTMYLKSKPDSTGALNDYTYEYSEFQAIANPFSTDWDKEKIQFQLSQNIRATDGNYDGMLGIVTNFNFTYNQEGGYDCTVKIISLGAIGDSLKINNTTTMPDIASEQIKQYIQIKAKKDAEEAAAKAIADINAKTAIAQKSLEETNSIKELSKSYYKVVNDEKTNKNTIYGSNNITKKDYYFIPIQPEATIPINRPHFAFSEFSDFLVNQYDNNNTTKVTIDFARLNTIINNISPNLVYNKVEDNLESGIYTNNIIVTNPEEQKLKIKWDTNQKFPILAALSNEHKGQSVKLSYYDETAKKYFNLELTIPFIVELGDNSDNIKLFAQKKQTTQRSAAELALSATTSLTATIVTAVGAEVFAPDTPSTDLYNDTIRDLIQSAVVNKDTIWTIDTNKTWLAPITENISTITTGDVDLGVNGLGYVDKKIILKLKTTITVNTNVRRTVANLAGDKEVKIALTDITIPIYLEIDDISLVSSFTQSFSTIEAQSANLEKQKRDLIAAATKEKETIIAAPIDTNTIDSQVISILRYQSNLELAIRAIQYYAAVKTIYSNKVEKIVLSGKDHKAMFKKIFNYGVFKPIVTDIINDSIIDINENKIDDNYITNAINLDELSRLKLFTKYGFNTAYIAGNTTPTKDLIVNYDDLTSVFVIPYNTSNNTEISAITSIVHPVYIQLGFLLMILNDMCTIYESSAPNATNKPLVYIDYNPETNRCLTLPQQLTSDALKFIIPCQATSAQYKEGLFLKNVTSGNTILAPAGSSATLLFRPETDDTVSNNIPPFRDANNVYSGKTMKILINCEYLLKIIEEYAANDGMNSVYLKPFLDHIVKDMNNYLGGINIFRVSYNDSANSFTIVDDQVQPLLDGENGITTNSATDELPVFGKTSIAKSLSIQTDISSKLSNMIAISANAKSQDQVVNSTNASSIGFINTAYTDRYIRLKKDTNNKDEKGHKNALGDSLLKTAQAFNETIKSYYKAGDINKANATSATNYYIERMSNLANENPATRASAMIPVSVNLSMHGLSGLNMGSAFTIPEQILPYTYSSRAIPNIDPTKQKIAFAAVGVSHTIQDNIWDTAIKAHMILVKDSAIYKTGAINTEFTKEAAISSLSAPSTNTGQADAYKNTDTYKNNEAFRKKVEELAAMYQTDADSFYRVMYKESGLKANAALYKNLNKTGKKYSNTPLPNHKLVAAGLIQFTNSTVPNIVPSLEAVLQMTPEVQMDYVIEYFKQSGLKSPATKYTIYSTVFFPLALRHLDDPNWTIQSRDLSPETISSSNPGIAKAVGKLPGTILTISDFIKYVDTI